MSAIKKFFEKKKLDVKFKKAGEGHKLNDDTKVEQRREPVVSVSAAAHRSPSEVSEEKRKAAEAAMARLSQPKSGNKSSGTQIVTLKAQMRDDVEKNRKEMERATHYATGPKEVELESAPVVSGVYFHCPLVGEEVLRKEDMDRRIEEFLYEQMEFEPEMTAALLMQTLNKNREQVGNCVETICKYLDNIIEHPQEEKYRKIRLSNKALNERVLSVRGSLDFMLAAGFEKKLIRGQEESQAAEEYLVFNENKAQDLDHLKSLKTVLVNAEPIRAELARCTTTFQITPSSKPASIQVPDEFYAVSPEELKREQRIRAEAVEQMGMLRTKQMRERDRIRELRRYRFCLIRVKFPNNTMCQATFRASEKLSDVRNWLQDCLEYNWVPYVLTTATGSKLELDDLSLAELDLAPASLLYFSYDQQVVEDIVKGSGQAQDAKFDPNIFLKPDLLLTSQIL